MNYSNFGLEVLTSNLPKLTPPYYDRVFVPGGSGYTVRVSGESDGVSPEWLAVKNFVEENKVPVAIGGASLIGLLIYAFWPSE
jgi:hypothetical protein